MGRDFASLDKDGKLLGYIGYSVSITAGRAHSFEMISFDIGNLQFLRDAQHVLCDIFEKYGLNCLSWAAYVGNPAMGGYERLCKKMGGRVAAYERQVARLLDGRLCDSKTFEVLAEEYFRSDFYRRRKRKR